MRRSTSTIAVLSVFAALAMTMVPTQAAVSCAGFCAGAASVNMDWHTGTGQGQYGSAGASATADKFDPYHHSTKMVPSDGAQSPGFVKAIVVKDAAGNKAAYAKVEGYLQQDVLTRRVSEIVSGLDPTAVQYAVPGLDGTRIMIGATHNHSAPMYTSTAWGVWLFTDVFDVRLFEETARSIARAIKQADDALAPAKMGASVTRFSDVQHNILGPGTADDGTPAGFPRDWFDDELSVVRFDRADGSGAIAALVNLGMHPESLEGVNLVSADFVGMTERIVERGMGRAPGAATGPVVAWSQGSVGDVEPDRDGRAHPPAQKRNYWHKNFSQAERMSRDLGAAVLDTWADVAAGTPGVAAKYVPFSTDVPVAMADMRFAGPVSHPLPTVSNCRTQNPGVPVIGLPDCERLGAPPGQYGTTLQNLRDAGVPVPDNYSTPSYGGVQESLRIHLQVLRVGEVVLASCPCEPISDMTLNFKSRADATSGSQFLGYEWPCRPAAGGGTECDFRSAAYLPANWKTVNQAAYERMRAQILNDAAGWESDYASLQGEHEPDDLDEIYGNFTHEEIQDLACGLGSCGGYTLPLMVGQANDYVGYIVTYREYQRGDHYRKALTAFGPHTADYVNTRLVRMAASLRGGAPVLDSVADTGVGAGDELAQLAKSFGFGAAGTGAIAGQDVVFPDDGGTAGLALAQPASLQRFGAASFSWQGGSNWTDRPVVRVERDSGAGWQTVATQEGGEIVLALTYESHLGSAPRDWLVGAKAYRWTAVWETFEQTAPGSYRFVVDGLHRKNRAANPYAATSATFTVSAWNGIGVSAPTVDAGAGTAAFSVSGVEASVPLGQLETDEDGILGAREIHYPDSYTAGALPYINRSLSTLGAHRYCFRCTFRAWADTGTVDAVTVSVRRSGGAVDTFPATFDGTKWVASGLALSTGDEIFVAAGGVADQYGNTNGSASATVVV